MLTKTLVGFAASALLTTAALAQAPQFGTAADAKAMLEKVVSAVKADKTKALDQFNKGEGGFKDRDLYPFCGNAGDGAMTAHPSAAVRAMKLQDIKDKDGKALGEEMLKVAKEGTVAEVTYKWPRPGSEAPVDKVTFVTKVADQVCGVGYYK